METYSDALRAAADILDLSFSPSNVGKAVIRIEELLRSIKKTTQYMEWVDDLLEKEQDRFENGDGEN